jgi:hypothetical protein
MMFTHAVLGNQAIQIIELLNTYRRAESYKSYPEFYNMHGISAW